MNEVSSIGFIEQNSEMVTSAICIVPLAIEIGCLAYSAIKNRKSVKTSVASFSRNVVDSMKFKEEETRAQYAKRLGKYMVMVAVATASISAVFAASLLVLPPIMAIPVAISTIILVGKIIYNFPKIKRDFFELKNVVVSSITQSANETVGAFIKRASINIIISLTFFAVIGGVGVASYSYLPLVFAVPFFLIATSLLLKAVVQRNEIINGFIPQKQETGLEASKRIGRNVLRALLVVSAISLTAFILPSVSSQLDVVFSGSTWIKVTGVATVIMAEYFIVGVAHLLLSAYKFSKSNKAEGCFHLSCGILAFLLPINLLFSGETMRLHHDFLGLAINLMPLRSFQVIGSAYIVDHTLYQNGSGRMDFSNIMVNNYSLIFSAIAFGSMLQLVSSTLIQSREKKAG